MSRRRTNTFFGSIGHFFISLPAWFEKKTSNIPLGICHRPSNLLLMKEILFILVFLGHLGYVPGVRWNCLRLVEDIILYESNLHYTRDERNFGEILSLNWCYISPLTNKHLQPTECLQPTLKCTFFGEFFWEKPNTFPQKVKKSPFSSVFWNLHP